MIQTAANLVAHVLPDVEIRQWVVTAPFELHGLLLADLDLMSAFIRIVVSSIFRHLEAKARQLEPRRKGVEPGRFGWWCGGSSGKRAGGKERIWVRAARGAATQLVARI